MSLTTDPATDAAATVHPAPRVGSRVPHPRGGDGRPAPRPVGTRRPARRPWARRPALWAFGTYLGVQVALLAVLRAAVPRFFWIDDAQIQFAPMSWWLGRRMAEGSLPLLDPDQGMAGNLTADMQYGVLDVVRWPFLLWAGTQQDLQLVATVHAWLAVLVLGSSAVAVLLGHRVRPALAVAAALGAATSGFLLWWGSAWSPLMWSVAALVWLWAALCSRRWYGLVGVGLATAAVVCSGNPYILPVVPVVVGLHGYERWRDGGRAVLRDRWTAATIAALGAGAALSVPTLVNALDVARWMWRPHAGDVIGSAGGGVNMLDVLVGGTTTLGGGSVPTLSTAVIALPLLAMVDWRRAVRGRGVPTAGALWIASMLLIQLPTFMLGFRMPWRLLAVVQVSFALLAVLAFTAAMRVDRRRVALAAGLLGLQFLVAMMRAPLLWKWHALAAALAVGALVAVVLLVRPRAAADAAARRGWVVHPALQRRIRALAATATVLACAAPLLVQLGMSAAIQERHMAFTPGAADVPVYRPNTTGYDVGTTVGEFRDNAWATDTSVSAWSFGVLGGRDDRGWDSGVLGGNANLPADLRAGYGSLAVWQRGVQEHVKLDYQSGLRFDQPGLMAVPEGAEVPWVDLLSGNRVLLGRTGQVPQEIALYFRQNWDFVGGRDGWREYVRHEPLPGRISQISGDDVVVTDAAANDGVARLGEPVERYTVSTGDEGGELVFRTPYWNGFHAALDGRPVPVSAFADSVLRIELPAGVSSAELEVSFEPIGARLLPFTVAGAAVLLTVAVLLGRSRRADAQP
ncbi:hypothetical protein E9549_18640 [Blastococcus sp. MG754426]|uniref:hypothetical protein n=1 Tax=unclassified Blastococcus TaxID=2619396 RepID=UPI001EF0097A|nr:MULTISPECIES: hypothetical protein [unclassified Blastococcus]MCF6509405.1 hypothetical protein [Blastococcus sp. MG754426]MCF6513898.1 hypothetical protein [Blastococcus sp. MG754427]